MRKLAERTTLHLFGKWMWNMASFLIEHGESSTHDMDSLGNVMMQNLEERKRLLLWGK